MHENLTIEVYWLIMTILMTAIMWLPYILNRMFEQGVLAALLDPHGHTQAKAPWANRMMSAHVNAVENLVIFAPLVILIVILEAGTASTALAVQLYFYARLAHILVYTFAVPLLRVVTFLLGFAAEIILIMALLG